MNLFESINNKLNESSISDIEEYLYNLDSEYREVLAQVIMDLGIIPDSPINMCYKNDQEDLYNKIINKQLTKKQATKIVTEIAKRMKGDFQYGQFESLLGRYIDDDIGEVSFDNIN